MVAPGLANVGTWRDWFDEAMNAKSLIHIINHHNYPQNGRDAIVELRTDRLFQPSLRTKMRDHGVDDKPFWLTETGRKTSDGNSASTTTTVCARFSKSSGSNVFSFFTIGTVPDKETVGSGS